MITQVKFGGRGRVIRNWRTNTDNGDSTLIITSPARL